jgi:arginine repressor
MGFETSQAAISRDLRALGVVKRKINKKMVYDLHAPDVSKEILEFAVQGVQHNETLRVVHTLPGFAPVVGDYLEMCSALPILSKLAGENVLFVVPESIKNIEHIYAEVCKALNVKETIQKEK